MKFLSKKIPFYFLLIATTIGVIISYAFTSVFNKKNETPTFAVVANNSVSNSCNFNISRLSGKKFIKPLLFAERTCEAERFSALKNAVSNVIDELKIKGNINTASVYVRLFQNGEWLSINDEIKYQPGSLFKVPLLITYLRLEEEKPGLLDKKLLYNQVAKEAKMFKQEFLKNKIQVGKLYSIKELLKYMIVHSDNNATMLLFNSISGLEFEKTFTDLGLDKNMTKSEGVITAKEYSTFWLTLYNSSYLNFDHSEYALSLLSESDFKEGMAKGIPQNVQISHKFGEKGDDKNHAFHETGIVYANKTPYLVTIMTQGNNQAQLPEALQQISYTVYSNIEGFTR